MKTGRACTLIAILAAGLATTAQAQTFPNKPVKVIIGFSAGGSTDIALRLIAGQFEKRLGQPLLVENRPGADGAIAARTVMVAEPDGHTLLFGGTIPVHPLFLRDNPIDFSKEFAPIGTSTASAWYVFVRGDLPVKSVADLVAYSKANPGKLNFGAPSITNTLVMAVFEARTGISSLKVPFKGAAPVVTAMLGGQVDVSASFLSSFLSAVQAGKIRVLVSTVRSAVLPEVPTAAEAGIPNLAVATTFGFWAPRGTPIAAIRKLSAEHAATVKSAEVAAALRKSDSEPIGSTPEEMLREFEQDIRFWTEAARLANFKPQ